MKIEPTFIIVGAGRAGTTTLYSYLDQHPEIFMSKVKEINFFNKYYHNGVEWYLNFFKDRREFSKMDKFYYLTKKRTGKEIAIGEASTKYFIELEIPKRIYKFNPDIKLIFMLRDPVKRAYSSYKWAVQYQGESKRFEDIIQLKDIEKIQEHFDIRSSFYYTNISRFLKYFSEDQMLFIIFEEFIKNPDKELKRICNFLTVDPSFKFDHNRINKNTSKPPASLKLQRIIWKIYTSTSLDDPLLKLAIYSKLVKIGNKLNHSLSTKKFPPLNESTRKYLLETYFLEEINKLEEFLEINLDIWK